MKQNNNYILKKIEQWQSFKFVKSLLCRREGCGEKLEGTERYGKAVLICPKCSMIQNHVPKSILEADVSIPDKLTKNQEKNRLLFNR